MSTLTFNITIHTIITLRTFQSLEPPPPPPIKRKREKKEEEEERRENNNKSGKTKKSIDVNFCFENFTLIFIVLQLSKLNEEFL